MPRSVYERAAGRGFPVWNVSGQSGTGALQDSTAPPARAGLPLGTWSDPENDPGGVAATLSPPEEWTLGGTLWGLSGGTNPDTSPRSAEGGPGTPQGPTHAAPIADATLPEPEYALEADAAHAPLFSMPQLRQETGAYPSRRLEHQTAEDGTNSPLQPLTGQIRANAGYDGVQGYGGGGDGPRGTNATMPVVTDERYYPGEAYTNVFVSAAEVPFLSAQADQFIMSDPGFPAWQGGGYDVPTASVQAQDPVTTDTPSQGASVRESAGSPAYAMSFWG